MVLPKCGHRDSTFLYLFHMLNCKDRTNTSPSCNKCNISLLIVPRYVEEEKNYGKNQTLQQSFFKKEKNHGLFYELMLWRSD